MHSPFVKIRKLSSPKDDLCPAWLELACDSGEKFTISLFSPLGNGPGLSFALFEFHSPKILCAMFSCNWSSRSAEKVGNVSVYRQAEAGTHVDQESSGVQVS